MADFEAVAKRSAQESYEALSRKDQQALDRIVGLLCIDPYIDPPVKTKFDVPPAVITLYNDLKYWVVYHLTSNRTIEIWNVGRATDDVDPFPSRRRR
jgi:hypothetical protein